ncbi:MAG: hypothetical protein LBQ66_07755, partial [Planctomycetaceae bacterium]|nr:hypothetical protein [Planctomycetaceae bacterium]
MKIIDIRGARTNNLKNISLKIPRGKIIVITGISGSGKTSLAIDTIHAEAERQFIETLSINTRQLIRQFQRPNVDNITGLPPTIAITQHSRINNRRSTVGTLSEIYDYLRLLFARVGIVYCKNCNAIIQNQSPQQIIKKILSLPPLTKFIILAPIARNQKGSHENTFNNITKAGFARTRIDGTMFDVQSLPKLDPNVPHNIDAVIDRLILKNDIELRLEESLQLALKHGEGNVTISRTKNNESDKTPTTNNTAKPNPSANNQIGGIETEWEDIQFTTLHSCPNCNINYTEIESRTFSFNSPYGACKNCGGTGFIETKNQKTAAKNTEIICPECQGTRLGIEARNVKVFDKYIHEICAMTTSDAIDFFTNVKIPNDKIEITDPILEQIMFRLNFMNNNGLDYMTLDRSSDSLSGGELQRVRLAYALGGAPVGVCYILDEPTAGLHPKDNKQLINSLHQLKNNGNSLIIVEHDEEIMREADLIIDIGTEAGELGGRVVAEIEFPKKISQQKKGTKKDHTNNPKSDLTKTESLTLKYLNGDLTIPIPAKHPVILDGTDNIIKLKGVSTNNLQNIDVIFPLGCFICVTGVSGSGKSSLIGDTLVPLLRDYCTINKRDNSNQPPNHTNTQIKCTGVSGFENIDKLIEVDQQPIGRSPRSNPATYTGLFDEIRKLFAQTKEAKQRGYKAGWFAMGTQNSRNENRASDMEKVVKKVVGNGCCDRCRGYGTLKIRMRFLGDLVVTCPDCGGRRYKRETLDILYKSKSIADVLDMSIADAAAFFKNVPQISKFLETLCEVGLGYLRLGQSAVTLSGGESQRIKLATELVKSSSNLLKYVKKTDEKNTSQTKNNKTTNEIKKTLYVLDEPTAGLHRHDVKQLIEMLSRLVDCGNTVIVVEHNLDMIKVSDWVIDLGPGGGKNGGKIIATGSPESI